VGVLHPPRNFYIIGYAMNLDKMLDIAKEFDKIKDKFGLEYVGDGDLPWSNKFVHEKCEVEHRMHDWRVKTTDGRTYEGKTLKELDDLLSRTIGTPCIGCGITIYAPLELGVRICTVCEDNLVSRCGNCHSIVNTRKCSKCGFISSPMGYYERGIELIKEEKRHEKQKGE